MAVRRAESMASKRALCEMRGLLGWRLTKELATMDFLKNLGDLPGLMKKATEMRYKMEQVQGDLVKRQVSADAGGGMVTAVVNGKLELVKIRIDPTKLNVGDVALLEDMVVAAVAAAQRKAGELIQEEMAKVSAEMGLPPGMNPLG
jgi:nucleoid-associated protein EbfC